MRHILPERGVYVVKQECAAVEGGGRETERGRESELTAASRCDNLQALPKNRWAELPAVLLLLHNFLSNNQHCQILFSMHLLMWSL